MGEADTEHGGASAEEAYEVLVVDDNHAVATIVSQSLEHADESIRTTYTTESRQALSRLQQEPVDCLVTDYEMPDINGLRLVERDGSDTPFVLFTQRREQWLEDRVRERGGEFLPKQTGSEQYRELAALVREQATG